jgi:hypothetical protein
VHDEERSLEVLRGLLGSPDERMRKDAAVKLLEYARGRPAQAQEEPRDVKLVFETVFAPPPHLVAAFDPSTVPPPAGIGEV